METILNLFPWEMPSLQALNGLIWQQNRKNWYIIQGIAQSTENKRETSKLYSRNWLALA